MVRLSDRENSVPPALCQSSRSAASRSKLSPTYLYLGVDPGNTAETSSPPVAQRNRTRDVHNRDKSVELFAAPLIHPRLAFWRTGKKGTGI